MSSFIRKLKNKTTKGQEYRGLSHKSKVNGSFPIMHWSINVPQECFWVAGLIDDVVGRRESFSSCGKRSKGIGDSVSLEGIVGPGLFPLSVSIAGY